MNKVLSKMDRLITMDGIDGCGKSSIILNIMSHLNGSKESQCIAFHPANVKQQIKYAEAPEFTNLLKIDAKFAKMYDQYMEILISSTASLKNTYSLYSKGELEFKNASTISMLAPHNAVKEMTDYLLEKYPSLFILLDRSWMSFYAYQVMTYGADIELLQYCLLGYLAKGTHNFIFTIENEDDPLMQPILSGNIQSDGCSLHHDSESVLRNRAYRSLLHTKMPLKMGNMLFHDVPFDKHYHVKKGAERNKSNKAVSQNLLRIILK